MTKQETADKLLAGLCELISVKNDGFDENRLFGFLIDNRYRVTLLANGEERLFLYALLGLWPEKPPETFEFDLLSANLDFASRSGPYLGYDLPSRSLVLAYSVPLETTTPEALKAIIEQMIQYQMHILKTFESEKIVLGQPEA